MRDDEMFSVAFGSFFALEVPPDCPGSPLLARQNTCAKEAYVNTIQEYRRTAESGNRAAQEMLGLMYLYGSRFCGEGVARDLPEAARWLELAAAQGSVLARQLLRRYVPAGIAGSLGGPIPGIADCGSPSIEGAA